MVDATQLEEFMLPKRAERLRKIASGRTRSLVVALDGVHDPHNLSATVRTCDAFGLLDLHVIETQARFRIRKKVTQGAEKWVDVHRWADPSACASELSRQNFEIWLADSEQNSLPIDQIPWDRRLALVFGNEHQGASDQIRKAATGTFHIPMHGFAESFNISVALGISLALAVRGRQRVSGTHGDLPAAEQAQLVDEWLKRSVRRSDLILERLSENGPAEREEP